MSVALVLTQQERRGILTALEFCIRLQCATSLGLRHLRLRLERFESNRRVLWAQTSIIFGKSCYGAIRRILTEKLLVCQRGVVKLLVIVLWAIEELTESWMHLVIVLGVLDVKVVDPAKLTVNISLLGQLSVVRHACALHFIFFIRVQLTLWVKQDSLLILEIFVKVLLWEHN